MNLKTIEYLLCRPARLLSSLGSKGLVNWLPDKPYLALLGRFELGYWMDMKNPKTFNEKLNWLKLYDRRPEYTMMADKYAARQYIAEKIGEQYLIPLVGGPWSSVDEIDIEALPEQFVLKSTHDSGGVVICRDKADFDWEKAKQKLKKHLEREYFWGKREWPYKDVPPRIIAEKYMEDQESPWLLDLKFFCFNGVPKFMYMSRDRSDTPATDFFDMDFRHLDMRMLDPNSSVPPKKPEGFEQMKRFAAVLSENVPHLRVDFYSINGKVYAGELTFYHNSGFTHIYPQQWEKTLGDWISLPEINHN